MRNFFILSMILLNISYANADSCSCGSYQDGMYDYFTTGEGDCCDGVQEPGTKASYTTFLPGPGRTWVVNEINDIGFSDAVKACCPDV